MVTVQPTRVPALLVTMLVVGVVTAAAAWAWYGSFPPVQVRDSLVLWVVAAAAGWLGVVVRRRIADGMVGFDRSQWSPVTVTWCAMGGRAVAWVAAAVAGAYGGVAVYVLAHRAELVAAAGDVPGVVAGCLAALAATAAGVWLERGCAVPL